MKNKLDQLKSLQGEIELLKGELNNIEHDKVYGSSREFPYTKRSFNIQGVSVKKYDIYREMIKRASLLEVEILDEISRVEDSEIRQILLLRGLKGYTWEQVGKTLRCHRDTARKKLDKFFEDF